MTDRDIAIIRCERFLWLSYLEDADFEALLALRRALQSAGSQELIELYASAIETFKTAHRSATAANLPRDPDGAEGFIVEDLLRISQRLLEVQHRSVGAVADLAADPAGSIPAARLQADMALLSQRAASWEFSGTYNLLTACWEQLFEIEADHREALFGVEPPAVQQPETMHGIRMMVTAGA